MVLAAVLNAENVFRCIPTGGAAAVALYYARKGCSSGERAVGFFDCFL